MGQVTGSMTAVVKNMDRAMSEMNLERVRPPPLSPGELPLTWLHSPNRYHS
jgi:hypothetical protein